MTTTQYSESLACSDEIALPTPHRPNKRMTAIATVLVIGAVMVTLSLTGKVDYLSPFLRAANVETVKLGEASSYDDVLSMLQNHQWPQMQDILCPAGKPNTTFSPTLFALARTQLGITPEDFMQTKKDQHSIPQEHSERELIYRFFDGQFQDACVYTRGDDTIAYIPVWKAANMAIRAWMTNSLAVQGAVEDIKTAALFNNTASIPVRKPTCVVTAIRDPISHFLSGYNEVEFRRPQIEDRHILPRYYGMPFNNSEQRHNRFVQFVLDLVVEDSKGLHGGPFGHVFSMTRILTELNSVGGFLSGYLPSIDHLSTEFPSFVKETCHLNEDLPAIHEGLGKHLSSQDPDGFYEAAKSVWKEQGEVARALCALHAIDYACWKNLPHGVPLLCQEVYSSPEFVAEILR